MKNRGFTLVELLAVLVLIAAIALISVPSIINYINESKTEISEVTEKLIFSGAELYVDANKKNFQTTQKQYCVTLKEIVDAKYLSAPILDSVSGREISLNQYIKIDHYYNIDKGNYDYQYEISNECTEQQYLCRSTTPTSQQLFNGSNGTMESAVVGVQATSDAPYALGVEYTCDLGDGEGRTFYVLKEEGNNVKLIMNENIGSTVAWCASGTDNSCAADGAKAYLASQTNGWTILSSAGVSVSLVDAQDIADAMGDKSWNDATWTGTKGPNWMRVNLNVETGPWGYWTSTVVSGNSDYAWSVSGEGDLGRGDVDYRYDSGVRPVITIPKSKIKN